MIKFPTIRIILSLAISKGWPLRQLDVDNAFLNGDLKEIVFMTQPPGFINKHHPTKVCRLHKSLYGFRQSPRAWYERLGNFLKQIGFISTASDASLFLRITRNSQIYMLVYVDDIIVTGSSTSDITQLIQTLSKEFKLKDMGKLQFFLGMELTPIGITGSYVLSQHRYISDILRQTNMHEAKSVSTPMPSTMKLTATDGTPMEDKSLYRSVVGALLYLVNTSPDISFAVNKLCQFLQNPTTSHWTAAKRVLRYLQGTRSYGILFAPSASVRIDVYSDADWAGCLDDRRSTGGFAIFIGNNLISWSSKKQPTIARSSTEAEFRILADAAVEAIWVQNLLKEIRLVPITQAQVWTDNLGAKYLGHNPVFHSKMKHMAINFGFVRELVKNRKIQVTHISTRDQIADGFTKPLSSSRFLEIISKLGVVSQAPT